MTRRTSPYDTMGVRSNAPNLFALLPRLKGHDDSAWIWIATAALFLICLVAVPAAIAPPALIAMAPFAAMLAIVSVGQTVVIQQRGLDMSCGGMMTLSGMVVAWFGYATHSALIAIPCTLAVAAFLGACNGWLVVRLNIAPIVATLATNALFLGAVHSISGGSPIAAPPALAEYAHGRIFGVPSVVFLSIAIIATFAVAIGKSLVGHRFIAVGANPAAAAAAGVDVVRYRVGAYAVSAFCAAIAGMLYAGFIGNASQTAGDNYLLPAIAAVVVGGASFSGGRCSVVGSAVAALFMSQLGQMVLSLGASAAIQLLVQAGAIILATLTRRLPMLVARMERKERANATTLLRDC